MNKWIPGRAVRQYTLLLLLLLVLSAVAVYSTLSFLSEHPALRTAPDALSVAQWMLCALSLGILCMAGALGLWGLRNVTEGESRRRIGRLIDGMDYVPDGVVAVDRKGRVAGLNRAARALAGRDAKPNEDLRHLFPCLSAREESVLLDKSRPREVECTVPSDVGTATWRFRSEPAEGLNQVLISDVSELKERDRRARQSANLQLVGRIAAGVAHDFNTVLCAIGGHAALLDRACGSQGQVADSLKAILREAERGAGLARQLVDLGRTTVDTAGTGQLPEHVARTGELLERALPTGWTVDISVPPACPHVPFNGLQVEQLVTKLGLLATASRERPGALQVTLRPPGAAAPWDVSSAFAAVLFVGGDPKHPGRLVRSACETTVSERGGVILSVLSTMVEDVEGRLDVFRERDGALSYRVCMPRFKEAAVGDDQEAYLAEELHSYLAEWRVLVACPRAPVGEEAERRMGELGVTVTHAEILDEALACIEQTDAPLTGILLDRQVMGDEAESLVRAILKLQPGAGLVLLDERPEHLPLALREEVVCVPGAVTPEAALKALIQSRERAARRAGGMV